MTNYYQGQRLIKKLDERIVTIAEIKDGALIMDGDYLQKQRVTLDQAEEYYTVIDPEQLIENAPPSMIHPQEAYRKTEDQVIKFVQGMNEMSQEEFQNKYNNNVAFHTGFNTLVRLFMRHSEDLETMKIDIDPIRHIRAHDVNFKEIDMKPLEEK